MDDMHRCRTEPRHAREEARARQHEVLDRRLVLPGPALAIGGDRATDEAWIDTLQSAPLHKTLQGRAGRKVLNEDVGAGKEAQELCRWRTRLQSGLGGTGRIKPLQSRAEIERHARLAAVPHDETSLAQVRSSGCDEAHDARALIAEEHRR